MLKTWKYQADYDEAYNSYSPEIDQWVGYCRLGVMSAARYDMDKLVNHFMWPKGSRILIFGCGFGWSMEYLIEEHNYPYVWGTDIGTWVQEEKNNICELDGLPWAKYPDRVLPHNLLVEEERNAFLGLHPDPFDIIITEHVVTTMEDSEILHMSQVLNSIAPNGQTVHIDTPLRLEGGQDQGYRWRTSAEIKLLVGQDKFVASNSEEIL